MRRLTFHELQTAYPILARVDLYSIRPRDAIAHIADVFAGPPALRDTADAYAELLVGHILDHPHAGLSPPQLCARILLDLWFSVANDKDVKHRLRALADAFPHQLDPDILRTHLLKAAADNHLPLPSAIRRTDCWDQTTVTFQMNPIILVELIKKAGEAHTHLPDYIRQIIYHHLDLKNERTTAL